jgi:c-di-GMP-binding flagellar brake protein YcgR
LASDKGKTDEPAEASEARSIRETLSANDFLEIRAPGDSDQLVCRSWVEQVEGDKLVVTWPRDPHDIRIPVRHGQSIELSFVRSDAAYNFHAVIEGRTADRFPRLILKTSGPPRRTQRREFFRVKTSLSLEITSATKGASGWVSLGPASLIQLKGRTYDLSGSGISFRHTDRIPAGSYVEAKLNLGELPLVRAICKVLDSKMIYSERNKSVYAVRMYIIQISESDRSRIVRFCFRVQQTDLTQ